ncbi:MAG TPA: M20/M25/M40 family metallo-hydrolase [Kofleriaceae bacterium]|nr:M20/M25/M40 family metallo-hydrolase [Kofleriaceae bacterium]
MKWLLALVALCGVAHAGDDSCVDDGKPYDQKALKARIEYLASADLGGRVPGTEGDKLARAHIVARMKCLGLTVSEQAFKDNEKKDTANVIGILKGSDDSGEIIIVGAHHDHEGNGHLGANDNASGVTGLLAIAQAMAQKDAKPKRTIAFIAFGAEEEGDLGSQFYAAHVPDELPMDKVVQLINLDMIGSYKSKSVVAAMGTFAKFPARKAIDKLVKGYPKTRFALGGHGYRSDHEAFCQQGIPYVFFWTPDARCYHQKCDKPSAIDLPHMADIASLAGDLTWELANSETDLLASRTKLGCGQK